MNELRELRQQIAALGRQSKFPFLVSHDDPTLGSVVDVAIVPRPNGLNGAAVEIYDGAEHLVLGSDVDAGYGLAQPQTQVPMYPSTPGLVFNSAGSATSMWTGQVQQNNSCFLAQWRFRVSSANVTAPTGSTYVQIVDSVTGWTWTSPTTTLADPVGSGDALVTVGPFAVQVPQDSIGNFFGIDLYGWVSANSGNSNAVAITPLSMIGCGYTLAQAFFAGTSTP
ncbi:hypothetical protein AB0K15_46535 [Amycolatopsis sp. NPDC049253]|uniref:hypothetical protein n=1 Tax=Amycolatopsis sp. NPDC049253 TaxID=3155274 RepID=UPI00342D078C